MKKCGGMAGQEAMTNEYVMGDQGSYNYNTQAEVEGTAVTEYSDYSQTDETVTQCMEVLNNPNATQEEIDEALATLSATVEQQHTTYTTLESVIDEQASRFVEQAEQNPDSRTEGEKEIVEGIQEEYDENIELSESNVASAEELREAAQSGEITFTGVKQTKRRRLGNNI